MSDEIRPALTPEEWAAWQAGDGSADWETIQAVWLSVGPSDNPTAAVMALANAALPDDDPRKLTWDDVRACRDDLNHYVEDREEMLRTLAAKLAALLPPREEG